jgi:hypothetical protein
MSGVHFLNFGCYKRTVFQAYIDELLESIFPVVIGVDRGKEE